MPAAVQTPPFDETTEEETGAEAETVTEEDEVEGREEGGGGGGVPRERGAKRRGGGAAANARSLQVQQLLFWGGLAAVVAMLATGFDVGPGKVCGARDMCQRQPPGQSSAGGGLVVCDWRRCHGCSLVVHSRYSAVGGALEEEFDFPCRRGKAHGARGVFTFESGDRYEGSFRQGLMHGRGRYDWHASGAWYEGGWADDAMEGHGELHTAAGDVYVGRFEAGAMHGRGAFVWGASGANYTGAFAAGLQHGVGTLAHADGSWYEGEFREGQQHGRGKWQSGSGGGASATAAGDIEAGRALLQGAEGGGGGGGGVHKYDGEWQGGKKHGRGTYTFADGHVLDGHFAADMLHGHGVKLGPNSQVLARGEWRAGKLHDGKVHEEL
jgi:prepilin-type processing-associated H-X9-DG protein